MNKIIDFSEGDLRYTAFFLGKYVALLGCTILATIGATAGVAAGFARAAVVDCDNRLKNKEEGSVHYHTMSPINLLKSVRDIFYPPTPEEVQARFRKSDPSDMGDTYRQGGGKLEGSQKNQQPTDEEVLDDIGVDEQ